MIKKIVTIFNINCNRNESHIHDERRLTFYKSTVSVECSIMKFDIILKLNVFKASYDSNTYIPKHCGVYLYETISGILNNVNNL